MANPYRALFQHPGTLAFASAGLVARMPLSMAGIGLITMLSQQRGSYWLAGAVAATFTVTMALAAPQVSRWVDRYGQGRVLPPVTALSVVAMLALLLASHFQAPDWTLFPLAVLAGFMPSMPAMVRARWTELYRGTPKLATAYSLESVLDEVSFIVGPPLAVGASVALFPEAGPLLAVLMLAAGVVALVRQRATEPPAHGASAGAQPSAMGLASVRALVMTLVALGVIVGAIDVISVAFAEAQGQPAAASVVLAVYAVGSCLAGLAFGALNPAWPLPRLLAWCAFATAVTALPLLWVDHTVALAAVLFLCGGFFAPTMIVAMRLVETLVSPAQLTEGLTWLITGLGVGVAGGAAVAGWVVDQAGVSTALWAPVVAGVLAWLLALGCCAVVRLNRLGIEQSRSGEGQPGRA